MKRLSPAVLIAFTIPLAGAAAGHAEDVESVRAPQDELRSEVRRMIAAARDQVFPSLVHIETIEVRYAGGQEVRDRSGGSGTIISGEGHVLTNHHVVMNGVRFTCTLADRREFAARLVGSDPLTDLAVLQLDLPGGGGAALPAARFGDSSKLAVGDWVMAMGSPYSLARSVTLGIVSNTDRVVSPALLGAEDEMELEPGQRTGIFTLWIQHDALINPGNSGGPLVDLAGDVVGINEMGGSAIGFAIPSNLARDIAVALIRHGEVPRSTIGVSLRPVPEAIAGSGGALIESVVADGPAFRAGLRAGDVLTALDGAPVSTRFAEEVPLLTRRIAELSVGEQVEVAYRRGGEARIAMLTTEKLPKDREAELAFRAWGLTAQQLTPRMAAELGLRDRSGVLVTGIRGGGPAQLAEPPLSPGDLIRAIDGRPVSSLSDLSSLYASLASRGLSTADVLIEFDRRGQSYLTLLRMASVVEEGAVPELPKAWIGVATQPVSLELARRLGIPEAHGYRISRVYPGTKAAAAGLVTGDIITALDGERLSPRGIEDSGLLESRVRRLEIGQTVVLSVLRNGRAERREVFLEATPMTPARAPRLRDADFGLAVREVTFFDRDENRWGDEVWGVLVERVEPTGWAEQAGLRPLDLLQRLGEREVRDLESFSRALAELAAAHPRSVTALVQRGARVHFIHLEPDWQVRSSAGESP